MHALTRKETVDFNKLYKRLRRNAGRAIEAYAAVKKFPIIPCNLCGSQEHLQRKAVKDMLRGWERAHPGRLDTIFASLQNVAPSHLADTRLFDFEGLGSAVQAGADANRRLA